MGVVPRLALVAAGLSLNVACFEVETTVALEKSGKGAYSTHIAVLPPFGEDAGIPPAPDRDQKKAMRKAGLHHLEYVRFSDPQRGDGVDLSVRFDRVSSLAALDTLEVKPDMHLEDVGSGRYRLTLKGRNRGHRRMPDGGGDLTSLFAAMGALDTLAKMRIEVTFEVPGRVDTFQPLWGTKTGEMVTWKLDSKRLLSGVAPDTEYVVEFTPKRAFPPKRVEIPVPGTAPI